MAHGVEHDSESTNSFLDVITASIGILIIMVMVAGQRAREAMDALAVAPATAELAAAQAEATAVEGQVHALAGQLAGVRAELAARSAARGELSTLVAAVEQELARQRAQLDGREQERFDRQRELAAAREELGRLKGELAAAAQKTEPKTIEIESFPTPLSKTVDQREAHFQLRGGKVAYVPFDALVDRLKGMLRELASRLQDQGDVQDTIGPVAGFRMKYSIERHDTPQGSYMQVSHVEFLPTSGDLGEPLSAALAAGSDLHDKLEMMSPRQYTITVWTYPDSFDAFRALKKELYRMGYAVAARPLPQGMPIGASPNGSRSSAQ